MVARREVLLGLAGALSFPRLAAAQTFTATSISQAAQDARRDAGKLARRADNLLRLTVADGPERGPAAVRRFRADQGPLSRDLAAIFNSRVSEDDWLLVAPTRELDLVLTMRPLVIRLAPTAKEVETAVKQPLAQVHPQDNEAAEDVLLALVLATLGLKRPPGELTAKLKNDYSLAEALKAATAALLAHRYGLAALELERLMHVLVLPANIAAINGQFGNGAERTIYKTLVVRLVPFIGWTFFSALLLATIYQNRETTAPMLR